MKRLTLTLSTAAIAIACLAPTPAQAAFGLKDLDVTFTDAGGAPSMQAGSHPFEMTLAGTVTTKIDPKTGRTVPDEEAKDVVVEFPPGLVGSPEAVPQCAVSDFLKTLDLSGETECADASKLGTAQVSIEAGIFLPPTFPIYNLEPSPGYAAKLGFIVLTVPVVIDVGLNPDPPYNLVGRAANLPQPLLVYAAQLKLWGVPADPGHDADRGGPVNVPEKPLLVLPTRCEGPLETTVEADSWQHPTPRPYPFQETIFTHDDSVPPNPLGTTGCSKLGFSPEISSKPTSRATESPSGLDFSVDIDDPGLMNPKGIAASQIKRAVITLPEGVTVNPSVAEGLEICTPAQYAKERPDSEAGEGCPQAAKIGSVEVESPLIEQELFKGSVYLAQQDDPATSAPGAENPFDSLLALYVTIKDRSLGVMINFAAKIEPDAKTSQITVETEELPQVPFSHFRLHLREGARSPLVTPPHCGAYETQTKFTPWADPDQTLTTTSSFEVISGIGGGPCPPGGIPPFHPDFQAGALNNLAGAFSPFNMRLIRHDGEQDMTKFSSVLPPGEVGSLVGVAKCPDAAIAIARAKSGRQELASPSCPQSSEIGHTLAGAGVGEALTYVPGQIYLGGPYHGDPLSVISITPAVAGPFDAGAVVVRLALTLNSKTAEVEVDGSASDPIPHILKGLVLKVRDLRVYVDRKDFLLNPTSCDPSSARATLFGSYLNVLDPADDVPVDLSTRYQAASCLNLGFKPRLDLKLKGGTKRGGHPGLIATYTPRAGDANVEGLVTRLPRSAFLDQAHIRTICTRVQFAAKACPPGAQYGYIKAWTPLLEEPLEGPVYLRSSNHKLPDLIFDLHGLVDVEVSVRIDSARGGIRATLENAPDAPLSKVVLKMQGAKKGLIINSRNLCGGTNKANVSFEGHNGKVASANPVMKPDCGGGRGHKRH